MNIGSYLERISYDKSVRLDIDKLHGLHLSHMLTVPFENLDIYQCLSKITESPYWNFALKATAT